MEHTGNATSNEMARNESGTVPKVRRHADVLPRNMATHSMTTSSSEPTEFASVLKMVERQPSDTGMLDLPDFTDFPSLTLPTNWWSDTPTATATIFQSIPTSEPQTTGLVAMAMNQKRAQQAAKPIKAAYGGGGDDDDDDDDGDDDSCGCADLCDDIDSTRDYEICIQACQDACPKDDDDDDNDGDDYNNNDVAPTPKKRQVQDKVPTLFSTIASLLPTVPSESISLPKESAPTKSFARPTLPVSVTLSGFLNTSTIPTPSRGSLSLAIPTIPSVPIPTVLIPNLPTASTSVIPIPIGGGESSSECKKKCEMTCQTVDLVFDVSQCSSSCAESCAQSERHGVSVLDKKRHHDPVGKLVGPAVGTGSEAYQNCLMECSGASQSAGIVFDVSQADESCKASCTQYAVAGSGILEKKHHDDPLGDVVGPAVGTGSEAYQNCVMECSVGSQTVGVVFDVSQADESCKASCSMYAGVGSGILAKKEISKASKSAMPTVTSAPTALPTATECDCGPRCADASDEFVDTLICVAACLKECPGYTKIGAEVVNTDT
ncbi:hypothetical protein F4778DRAFT_399664 [Xylariomycetidae sp. FL2044]|nr:hypothetical protein F4778DRAFT_399664 [Xylariomycetidae sp. FL2044]